MVDVVLFSRPGCHLCDDARVILERVRRAHPFALSERDIESDERWLRAYLERIPVVTIDGVEHFELFVDEAAFVAVLAGEAEGRSPVAPGEPSTMDRA